MTTHIPTVEERRALGKACRDKLHRVDQGRWTRKSGVDVVALLLACVQDRVQELLPIKWGRMAASPFGFFRGAVPLMAADLAAAPTTGITVQICGDAHVRNLGAFAAPDGRLIFDINDFDETTTGPWEWDVKRLATSLVLAGREVGGSDKPCHDAVREFVSTYRNVLDQCSNMSVLELARYQVRRDLAATPVADVLRKAEKATPQHNLEKLTELKQGARRFKEAKPLLTRVSAETTKQVLDALSEYKKTLSSERRHFLERYCPVDVAFKVVGTGSVGTRDYVVLGFGNGPDDPLFLQVKEEPPSAYAAYVKKQPGPTHEGQRVAEGQRLMQAQSDIFLGWTALDGRHYLVRQLNDHKAAIETEDLNGHALVEFAQVCGEILAKAHARSGDACVLAGYCGMADKLDKAVAEFAVAYADQTEKDYQGLLAAIKAGTLKAANP